MSDPTKYTPIEEEIEVLHRENDDPLTSEERRFFNMICIRCLHHGHRLTPDPTDTRMWWIVDRNTGEVVERVTEQFLHFAYESGVETLVKRRDLPPSSS